MSRLPWIILLHGVSAKSGALRLSLWRQIKRLGAVSLKTSASVLPDRPDLFESFQWLAQSVRERGGEATLVRAKEVDGVGDEEIVALFQQARTADYEEILGDARALLAEKNRKARASPETIEKLAARLQAVRRIDFFECPKAAEVETLLRRLEGRSSTSSKSRPLAARHFQKRIWLTRPRPEVDRVGSAWLIHRFIDTQATFVFASDASAHPDALPFDMVGVEFGHHGDDCTFETLLRRFSLTDPALRKVAAIIHDADLGDDRHGTHEGAGLLAIFRGWAQIGRTDQEILERGFDCFDALWHHLSSRKSARK